MHNQFFRNFHEIFKILGNIQIKNAFKLRQFSAKLLD